MDKKQKWLWDELRDVWHEGSIACHIHLAEVYSNRYPEDMFGFIALADGLARVSSFNRALVALETAEKLCPDELRPVIYSQYGRFYREKCDLLREEHFCRKAVAESEKQEYLVLLGACLARQGKFADAKKVHRKAIKFSPQTADEAYLNLGLILRAEGKYAEALNSFEKAIEIDPDYTDAKSAKADILKLFKIRSAGISQRKSKRRTSKSD